MEESILLTIKKLLGISDDDTAFDEDVAVHINTVIMAMRQFGIGPDHFSITGDTETWSNLLGNSYNGDLEAVKTYLYLRVKKVFDPTGSSIVAEAMNQTISELEWRLNSEVDFN